MLDSTLVVGICSVPEFNRSESNGINCGTER
jgi:hypothetical protein